MDTSLSHPPIPPGEVAVCWLGQAGFRIEDAEGTVFLIDPYLSDCGFRIRGFKRLSPQLFTIRALKPDYYCITHTHFDHFDFDTVPQAFRETSCRFVGPPSVQRELKKLGVPESRRVTLAAGDQDTFRELRILAVPADHGTMAPDAIGVLLEVGNHTLYFSGDTAYHSDWNTHIRKNHPDIGFLSMNGAFGNMNAQEAAQAAGELGLQQAVPCHFWTFAEHGGDPAAFAHHLTAKAPGCALHMLRQGETWITGGNNT